MRVSIENFSGMLQVAGEAIEASEDMFLAPVDLIKRASPEEYHDQEPGKAGDGGGSTLEGRGGSGNASDVAPLPVDLVCNGVWRPLQQVNACLYGVTTYIQIVYL